jgi:hypothetical protein
MGSDIPKRPPLIETASLAIFAGCLIGIFYVWYAWTWRNFLSGLAAGIGFTVTFFILTGILQLSIEKWRLYLYTSIAGFVGGLLWWMVANTETNTLIPMLIGATVAPIVMWLDTGRYSGKSS